MKTKPGTAKPGSDFIPIDKTLTFARDQSRIEVNVTFVGDLIVEPDESFRIDVTSSDNRVNIMCTDIDFTIKNDDSKLTYFVFLVEYL